jgi:hypothetical protein
MIADSNIKSLLSQWKERLNNNNYSEDYKCCLGECMYDLQNLLEKIKQEEEDNLQEVIDNLPSLDAEEYLKELEADEYLASLEAHIA